MPGSALVVKSKQDSADPECQPELRVENEPWKLPKAAHIYPVTPWLRALPRLPAAAGLVLGPPVWPETPAFVQAAPHLVSYTLPGSPHGTHCCSSGPKLIPPQSLRARHPTAGNIPTFDFSLLSLTIRVSVYVALP